MAQQCGPTQDAENLLAAGVVQRGGQVETAVDGNGLELAGLVVVVTDDRAGAGRVDWQRARDDLLECVPVGVGLMRSRVQQPGSVVPDIDTRGRLPVDRIAVDLAKWQP